MRSKLKTLIKSLFAIADILLAVFTIFSAYGGLIDPESSSAGALAAMLFPPAICAVVIMMLAAIFVHRYLALLNIAVVIICWGPFMAICPLNFFRANPTEVEAEGNKVLKVVTFNTFGLQDFENDNHETIPSNSLQFMIDCDADILLCQELYPWKTVLSRKYNSMQTDSLAKRYPYSSNDERGMAIFSKYPFEKIPLHYNDSYKYDVCRYDVNIDSVTVHVFNMHLQSIGLTDSDKKLYHDITEGDTDSDFTHIRHDLLGKLSLAFVERARQSRIIRKFIDDAPGRILVAGDFNDIPLCYAYRTISGDNLTDVYRRAGLGFDISYHADRFYFRIDQMLCSDGLLPLQAQYGGTGSSDHYPLTAWLQLL
ncbi:MAG: hypothetical protein K2M94_07270 [Paramuribaculum sp.]|nr:hypothetical protein [Paramuribaculum sp.]